MSSTKGTTLASFSSARTSSTVKTDAAILDLYSLVNQMNSFHNMDILFRIRGCDSNMKLNDICEIFTIDNNTNSLIRLANIEFETLQNLSDILVDRIVVQKLHKLCSPNEWCLTNLSESDVRIIYEIIREHGASICSLQQCNTRLQIFIDTCPILSNKNISTITLELLPMLCTLYNEQIWSSSQCAEGIVYFLHMIYAFWPQIQECHYNISNGFDVCTSTCQTLDDVLNKVKAQCINYRTFLFRVSTLSLYQSINLKELCHQTSIFTRPQFIYSVEKFFSSNLFLNQFHGKPIYTIMFSIVIVLSALSFILCFYFMSKNHCKSNKRRFDNNYAYTRLHDASFELGTNIEISNMNSTTNQKATNELESDSDTRFRLSEYERLLHAES